MGETLAGASADMAGRGELVFWYWLLAGVVSLCVFLCLTLARESTRHPGNRRTLLARCLFFFVCGGALLPLAVVLGAPLFGASIFAAALEKGEQATSNKPATDEGTASHG